MLHKSPKMHKLLSALHNEYDENILYENVRKLLDLIMISLFSKQELSYNAI